MSRFRDAVRRLKNIVKIENVYDCARPLLLVLGLVGAGGTYIRKIAGVHSLHNTKYSYLVTAVIVVLLAVVLQQMSGTIFTLPYKQFYLRVSVLISSISLTIMIFTITAGFLLALVSCKRLDRLFEIINNIDSQLAAVNIRVQHWHITLKVMILLVIVSAITIQYGMRTFKFHWILLCFVLFIILFDLFYTWVILIMLIIHERFTCLNKLLIENATVTNFEIVGERGLRDNYMLRRISLARHIHEQLTEVVQLFSDSCRYIIIGLLAKLMMEVLQQTLFGFAKRSSVDYPILVKCFTQIVLLIHICQANKSERRVLSARLRNLVAFETNRDIIIQVQQYIMYNAYSVKGIIDLQFTDIDNVLLFTIIDIIISNMLIIYSYYR